MTVNEVPDRDWLLGRQLSAQMERVSQVLTPSSEPSPFRGIEHRFVIACTSRTGSYYLSQRLAEYGADVQEYFSLMRIEAEAREHGFDTLGRYASHLVYRHGNAGVFGVKGAPYVLAPLFMLSEFPDELRNWKFVYLTRRNIVRQAVSLVIAELSGAWMATTPATREVSDADYDKSRIAASVQAILAQQALWENFFAVFQIQPMRITYEELDAEPDGALTGVAMFLGLSPGRRGVSTEVGTTRQATELNAVWHARFLADCIAHRPYVQ
jgi:LPS sulfotransferase NodH